MTVAQELGLTDLARLINEKDVSTPGDPKMLEMLSGESAATVSPPESPPPSTCSAKPAGRPLPPLNSHMLLNQHPQTTVSPPQVKDNPRPGIPHRNLALKPEQDQGRGRGRGRGLGRGEGVEKLVGGIR